MAVYKTDTGKWLAKISYRDNFDNVKSKEKRFSTKREAQDFETDFRRNLSSEISSNLTFNEVFENYLKKSSTSANENTINEKRRVKKVFFENLSNKRFNKITRKDYLDVWLKISNTDYSISYKNKAIAHLKAVARYAYVYYEIKDNSIALESLSKTSDDLNDMQVWTEEDFDKFYQMLDSLTMKAFFRFLFYTGSRRGEAIALQKSDIKGNLVSITKSMKHNKHGFMPLKTTNSRRTIQLDNDTLSVINDVIKTEGDFLFGGSTSLSISKIQRTFTEAKIASGVKDIRLHDLRHSHASLLLNRGANIVAVSRRLGHSDVGMTLKVYTHLMDESEDELLSLLK